MDPFFKNSNIFLPEKSIIRKWIFIQILLEETAMRCNAFPVIAEIAPGWETSQAGCDFGCEANHLPGCWGLRAGQLSMNSMQFSIVLKACDFGGQIMSDVLSKDTEDCENVQWVVLMLKIDLIDIYVVVAKFDNILGKYNAIFQDRQVTFGIDCFLLVSAIRADAPQSTPIITFPAPISQEKSTCMQSFFGLRQKWTFACLDLVESSYNLKIVPFSNYLNINSISSNTIAFDAACALRKFCASKLVGWKLRSRMLAWMLLSKFVGC